MKENLTKKEEGFIEGAAYACDRLMYLLTGDSSSSKSYDPATIEGNTLHSYAFNLKDGGRHHSLDDYEDSQEILDLMIQETLDWIKENT